MKLLEQYKGRVKERGNVLFLILIAVALFAALSYAVTQTTRSSGGNASGEVELISSAQITQYPAGVRTAVVRMVISGTDPSELLFDTPSDFASLAALELERAVFHPSGGGATFQQAPNDLIVGSADSDGHWHYNTEFEFPNIGISGNGGADLTAFLPGLSAGVCRRINDELGISGIPFYAADQSASYLSNIAANNTNSAAAYPTLVAFNVAGTATVTAATAPADLSGQPFGCFENVSGSGNYVYYHIIMER